ncbi:MAG: YebC/PmpR family DNA-binding transcriptional regulator [Clostridia bacterium]|nr:YebC/PmpR family DNA-binding transcriptional regulator [Clostridia bacterium]
MSGHSKWSTIKRKKGANDAARAKVFTKLAREISVAVKEGGADPNNNARLRDLLAKGRAANVPQDNLMRAIKKAGDNDKENYESITYEGYGNGGIAVIVECLSDNRNRTAGDVRHYFDKFGGNMGTSGCVMFMFDRFGVIIVEKDGVDEEKLMEDAIECGATDFLTDDEEIFEIRTEPNDLGAVSGDLEAKGYKFVSAEVAYIPQTYTRLEDQDQMKQMSRMLEMFEDNDDIQAVWHNWENEDEYEG